MVSGNLRPELDVTQPIERDAIYPRRRFPREIIEACVRWYLTYRLSYRDLVALMAEWDVHVSHTTIMRWVFRYVPEYEKRWNRRAKPVGSSWRVDETYIRTRPRTGYLYRAGDKQGKTVESLFQTQRGIAAAMAFSARQWHLTHPDGRARLPWMVTSRAIGHCAGCVARIAVWAYVLVRKCRYLNSIVEQDHRAIKSRCRPMLGFKSCRSAAVTLAGIELAHRIRKRQFKFGPGRWSCWSLKGNGTEHWREFVGGLASSRSTGIP